MAEEKNLSQLDVKDIFSKVNFRSILSNKSYVYVAASFFLFFILSYLIYGLYVNQDAYESQKQRFNIASNKANNTQKENTYDRGRTCLDMMAMSKSINKEVVKKCGIMPFYDSIPSDHRAFYCDIDIEQLFSEVHIDTNKKGSKRFSTEQLRPCEKYQKNSPKGVSW